MFRYLLAYMYSLCNKSKLYIYVPTNKEVKNTIKKIKCKYMTKPATISNNTPPSSINTKPTLILKNNQSLIDDIFGNSNSKKPMILYGRTDQYYNKFIPREFEWIFPCYNCQSPTARDITYNQHVAYMCKSCVPRTDLF